MFLFKENEEMKRFALTAAGVASAAVVASASADVTYSFDTGADPTAFPGLSVIALQGDLSGTLTGMAITVDFYDSANPDDVWASDLLVAVSDGASSGIEYGGYDASFGFVDGGSFSWNRTYGIYSASFSGSPFAINGGTLAVANGYVNSLGGSWRGTITLYGVDVVPPVPAPGAGAAALLGLAGLTGRRRRN